MLSKPRHFGQPGGSLEAATIPSQISAEQNWIATAVNWSQIFKGGMISNSGGIYGG